MSRRPWNTEVIWLFLNRQSASDPNLISIKKHCKCEEVKMIKPNLVTTVLLSCRFMNLSINTWSQCKPSCEACRFSKMHSCPALKIGCLHPSFRHLNQTFESCSCRTVNNCSLSFLFYKWRRCLGRVRRDWCLVLKCNYNGKINFF